MNFKKIQVILWVFVATLVSLSTQSNAQCDAKFTASTVNGKTGDIVKVNITVDKFTELSVFQWTMRWDTSVLQFQSIQDFDLPDLTAQSFNLLKTNQGYFTTAWFYQLSATKTNGSTIFTITFKLKGADGKASNITFSDNPLKREFADKNSQTCTNVTTVDGRVNIGTVINPPPTGASLKLGSVNNAAKDQEICVPMTVTGFSSITAMQFSLTWDTSKLKYTTIKNFKGLSSFDLGNFGTSLAPTGKMTCVWIDQNTTGQTVTDNTVIFEICYKYSGSCPGTATIDIGDNPTKTDVVATSGKLDLTKQSGTVNVSVCTSVFNVVASKVTHPCPGQSNGAIEITTTGGSGTLTYAWTNGATSQNLSNLPVGNYNVTVKDGSNNTATLQAQVTLASLAVTSQKTDPTSGQSNGAITLTVSGGSPTITYMWSNNATTKDINNLAVGTYTYTVKDGNNCTVTGSVSIGNVALDVTTAPTNPACSGQNTGAINITALGGTAPYTYAWTGPNNFTSTSEDLSGLAPGTYKVTVKDAANATKTSADITLSNPSAIVVNGTPKPVSVLGNDGAISLSVSGGTPGYTFNWSDGSSNSSRTSLSKGNYTVNVTDSRGCTGSKAFSISDGSSNAACFTSVRVFTPNNDGINELFVINCIPSNNQLLVYNRWSQLVFSANNYSNNWNGVDSNGVFLQDGTYYWILKDTSGGTNAIYKGYVSLLRSLN
ncbi:MAG: gliding motility-associated C-terminal domain-containing protein [Saprospiraceae bacterium]